VGQAHASGVAGHPFGLAGVGIFADAVAWDGQCLRVRHHSWHVGGRDCGRWDVGSHPL